MLHIYIYIYIYDISRLRGNLSIFDEFSSGSVQNGAFRATYIAVAENSVVSNQIVLIILSIFLCPKNMHRICDGVTAKY